jgi:hypothetical protein
MELEIELGVLDPIRVVEAQGHLYELAAERRKEVNPVGDQFSEPLEVEPVGCGRGVEDDHTCDVTVLGRRLEVEEAGVEACELMHGSRR